MFQSHSYDWLSPKIVLIHAISVKCGARRRFYGRAVVSENLKGYRRVCWLRGINFGQCIGRYVHSNRPEGPYFYRFNNHPKSYRLPTIVKLAVFFYPGERHRTNHPSCGSAPLAQRGSSNPRTGSNNLSTTSTKPDQAGCGSLFAWPCGGNPFISNKTLAKIIGSQNSIGICTFPYSAGKP
jgi:hypothetical protein